MTGVSIVICTFNGREKIAAAIESVFSQQRNTDIEWELIIIDNASKDSTQDFCKNILKNSAHASKCRIITEPKSGIGHARARAFFTAAYEWLLFVDDDNRLFPDYLQKGVDIIGKTPGIGALGGYGIAEFQGVEPDWFAINNLTYAVGPQQGADGLLSLSSKRKLYSAGCFFRKEIILKYYQSDINPLMIDRGEDNELCMMIELAGFALCYSGQLRFYHVISESRLTWEYFQKLKSDNASGAARFMAYAPFYKSKLPGTLLFWHLYLISLLKYQLLSAKYNLMFYERTPEFIFGKKIIKAKAVSFLRNASVSFSQFKRLRKNINHIHSGLQALPI